jgi:uncharacterized phage protein (TIGR02218 family)
MSYDSLESSLDQNQPTRLYHFFRGGLQWRYTVHTQDINWQGVTFESVSGISDNGLRQTGQATADALQITAPASLPVAQLWQGTPPGGAINLTVYDLQWDDSTGGLVGIVAWVGQVTDARNTAADRCVLTAQSISALLDRQGLRLTWQRECPHAFGDKNCKVDVTRYRIAAVIASLDGASIAASALAGFTARWFVGGWVAWSIGSGETESRGIEAYNATTGSITLIGGTQGLSVGTDVEVYPGCPGTTDACQGSFNNLPNYGGCPGMPGVSPFDGTPIF